MAKPGQQSKAHEYNYRDVCYWCDMYKNNVEALSHECTSVREFVSDSNAKDVVTAKKNLSIGFGKVESLRMLEMFETEKLRVKEEKVHEELILKKKNGLGRQKPFYGVVHG